MQYGLWRHTSGMSNTRWIFIFTLQSVYITSVIGSTGDRSQFYNLCLAKCRGINCLANEDFKVQPSLFLRLLFWSCEEDCRYVCTWETVNYFTSHGLKVPQFHGKWPFIRLFGCQEPASVIFSILNFYAHITMYWKFKRKLRPTDPMFYVWTYFSMVCMHGWFWSSVFHARDITFTEVMDYSSAFVMVLTLLYCMLLRVTYKNNKIFAVITCGYLSTLYTHLSHLWSGDINYDYNMKFNILIEIADFAPIFWVFDAHSLWHASTAPLTILLYRFMIADCSFLRTYYSKLTLDIEHHIR